MRGRLFAPRSIGNDVMGVDVEDELVAGERGVTRGDIGGIRYRKRSARRRAVGRATVGLRAAT